MTFWEFYSQHPVAGIIVSFVALAAFLAFLLVIFPIRITWHRRELPKGGDR